MPIFKLFHNPESVTQVKQKIENLIETFASQKEISISAEWVGNTLKLSSSKNIKNIDFTVEDFNSFLKKDGNVALIQKIEKIIDSIAKYPDPGPEINRLE